jgi:hypothetical protein
MRIATGSSDMKRATPSPTVSSNVFPSESLRRTWETSSPAFSTVPPTRNPSSPQYPPSTLLLGPVRSAVADLGGAIRCLQSSGSSSPRFEQTSTPSWLRASCLQSRRVYLTLTDTPFSNSSSAKDPMTASSATTRSPTGTGDSPVSHGASTRPGVWFSSLSLRG